MPLPPSIFEILKRYIEYNIISEFDEMMVLAPSPLIFTDFLEKFNRV